MSDEQKLALRQFNYCQQLCKAMFEVSERFKKFACSSLIECFKILFLKEGLLECQDFLQWQLDMLEKCKTCDDGLLKLVVPFILQYIEEFTQCETLSRKLVFQVELILSVHSHYRSHYQIRHSERLKRIFFCRGY